MSRTMEGALQACEKDQRKEEVGRSKNRADGRTRPRPESIGPLQISRGEGGASKMTIKTMTTADALVCDPRSDVPGFISPHVPSTCPSEGHLSFIHGHGISPTIITVLIRMSSKKMHHIDSALHCQRSDTGAYMPLKTLGDSARPGENPCCVTRYQSQVKEGVESLTEMDRCW